MRLRLLRINFPPPDENQRALQIKAITAKMRWNHSLVLLEKLKNKTTKKEKLVQQEITDLKLLERGILKRMTDKIIEEYTESPLGLP